MAVVQAKDILNVRRATTLDDLQWIFEEASKEGWMTRKMDANHIFTAGIMHQFFVGELNGERISCVSLVIHSDNVAVVGYFLVLPPFRGKGYGLKTWKDAFEITGRDGDFEFRLFSVMGMLHAYPKMGFKPGWMTRRYSFSCSQAAESLSDCTVPSTVAKILPGCQVNFEDFLAYGADLLAPSQASKLVLAAWLSHENSWVAIGNKGEIVGYLVLSKTARFPEEGFKVAPLFADSAPIARILFKKAIEYATPYNPGCLSIDVPKNDNTEGDNIVTKEFGGKLLFDCVYMGTKGIPKVPLQKAFGTASIEIM